MKNRHYLRHILAITALLFNGETIYSQTYPIENYLKFPTLINRWKNNSLSNFLCKLVIDKQLISKAKQQNCYGSKNRENI